MKVVILNKHVEKFILDMLIMLLICIERFRIFSYFSAVFLCEGGTICLFLNNNMLVIMLNKMMYLRFLLFFSYHTIL